MALSGDVQSFSQIPRISLDSSVTVASNGLIVDSNDDNVRTVNGVIRVCFGSLEDVRHLIGHELIRIAPLMENESIEASKDVNQIVSKFPVRHPNAHLVEVGGHLYGVVIDLSGELHIVGIVRCVIPAIHGDKSCDSVIIKANDASSLCSTDKTFLQSVVDPSAHVAIVCGSDYLFLQTDHCADGEFAELVLILSGGFVFIERTEVNDVKMCEDYKETVVKTLRFDDCVLVNRGACVRDIDGFELYGSEHIMRLSSLSFLSQSNDTPLCAQHSSELNGDDICPDVNSLTLSSDDSDEYFNVNDEDYDY